MFLQQLISGLMLGSTYSLCAIGYTLILGVLNLLHFAHGEVLMMGAYFALQLILLAHVNIYVALIGACIGSALLGMLIELVAFRPIKKEYYIAPFVATMGVSIILREIAVHVFGGYHVAFPETVIKINYYKIGMISINSIQILIFLTSLIVLTISWLFINRTKVGIAMKAMAESPRTAALLGININRIITITFAVASSLAGISGVLIGLAYHGISPYIGIPMAFRGFIIMLLGGLGNVFGAMVGGLILGVVESFSSTYFSSSYRDFFSFSLMIVILLFKPTGLFGLRIHGE